MKTLSDKIEPKGLSEFGNQKIGHIPVEDVKQFIKDIEEIMHIGSRKRRLELLREKAGDKLI